VFRGHAEAKIDVKGRLKVPSVFLRPLQEQYGPDIFTTSLHGDCAWIYPLRLWEKHEREVAELAPLGVRRKYEDRVSYFGQQSRLDAQGRLIVPGRLREWAGIDGEVVVFGKPDRLEVWNLKRKESEFQSDPFTEEDEDELARALASLHENRSGQG